jgi:hypothetical protein
MALGPGKYDDLCTYVREQAGVSDEGGAIVIVMGGKRGSGFACQADIASTLALPDLLEHIARQIRRDGMG